MFENRLVNIGFGNFVSSGRIIAIVSPESNPIKRIVHEAREKGMVIDATYGRRTRAVVITETIAGRLDVKEDEEEEEKLGK